MPDVVERFFGTFDGSVYRACVALRGASYGLEAGLIPGGRCARERLRVVEHYRRHDEIDLLVPVA